MFSLKIKNIFFGWFLASVLSFQWFFVVSKSFADIFASQVKAAFVLKIIDFVEWPNEENTTFVVSVLGDEELFNGFKSLEIIKIKRRSLILKKYNDHDKDKKKCHVFFISKSKSKMLPKVLEKFENIPVLLMGDIPNFAQMGGMINLIELDGKLGMEINLKKSKDAGLKISSRLLRLAKIVND